MSYKVNNNELNMDGTTIYNDDYESNSKIIILNDENFNDLINKLKIKIH